MRRGVWWGRSFSEREYMHATRDCPHTNAKTNGKCQAFYSVPRPDCGPKAQNTPTPSAKHSNAIIAKTYQRVGLGVRERDISCLFCGHDVGLI